MSHILSIKGYHLGIKWELKPRVTFGRAEDNDIYLPTGNVSRYHAIIEKRGNLYYIKDLGSTNGLFINGKKVQEQVLRSQDTIQIGDTIFIYEPEFNLKNLVFDNKTICLTSPSAETVRIEPDRDLEGTEEKSAYEALQVIEQIADLFTPERLTLPDTLRTIARQVSTILKGDGCVLFLEDIATHQLEPMVGYGSIEDMPLSNQVIHQSFEERKTLYISTAYPSESVVLPETISAQAYTLAVAPLLVTRETESERGQELCIGVLCLLKKAAHAFTIKDITSLRAIGRLIAMPIEIARKCEHLERIQSAASAGPWQEISIMMGSSSQKMIFQDSAMNEVLHVSRQVAEYSTNVLLEGETGTGKELIARYIHAESPRNAAPFIALNCAAIPETLFESELFGYERGSFTGAEQRKIGKAEIAHGGTLFLDEISELKPSLQPKLLRFIEEKAFYRIGGTRPITVDLRIIAATNKNLESLIHENLFRQDLFFRLGVVTIEIPPLRKRRADIRILAEFFLRHYCSEFGKSIAGMSDDAVIALENYPWYGNVRELQNCIERAALLCESRCLEKSHLFLPLTARFDKVRDETILSQEEEHPSKDLAVTALEDVEKDHIRAMLEKCSWNQIKAAELLGIHRNTLRKKIQQYKLMDNK